jgi:Fe-S cluster assembly protein SufD
MSIAVMKTKAELALVEQFQGALAALPGGQDVTRTRRGAIAAFAELGLPHRRIEEWKYTDLRAALKDPAPPPSVSDTAKLTVGDLIVAMGPYMELDAPRIVFVNGHYRRALSNLSGAEAIRVVPLNEHFDTLTDTTFDAVSALNTAFVTDGAVVDIPAGTTLDKPLLLVSLAAGKDAQSSTVRHKIKVGADAKAVIVELFLTLQGSALEQHMNAFSEVAVGDRAEVTHVKAASDGGRSTHLSNLVVALGADANYRGFALTSGQALTRNQIAVRFDGEGSKLDLSGAFLGRGGDHIDTTLTVDHAVPHCESREFFTGVLDGRARGIFQGKVIVRPDAQKTDGKQMAKVLMLSPDAEFDSKPELEIYADDVVCGHGSTAAQIDEDLLFYCQARGIPKDQARALLVESFIGEAIDRVENEGVRAALAQTAREWLAMPAA